jgi:putative addiction module component (TIGR02574 family)
VMSRNDALHAAVLALPVEERAELALELVDSLDEPEDEGAEEAWVDEIALRFMSLRAGTAKVVPFSEAMAAARERIAPRRA